MAEDTLMALDVLTGASFDDRVICPQCFTKVPRGLFEIHSTQHADPCIKMEDVEAGRGGRAELPETFPIQAFPIRGAQPLRKYLGGLSESHSAMQADPPSFYNAGDSSAERKRSIEDLKNNAGKYQQRRKKGQLGVCSPFLA